MTGNRNDEPKHGMVETGSDQGTGDERAGEAKITNSRRRLIQALAASGVVVSSGLIPDKWGKPVVDSVALPAHAQTTGEEVCTLGTRAAQSGLTDPSSLYERIVDTGLEAAGALAGPAWAGATEDGPVLELCPQFSGCFWIRFPCNSDRGQLFARIFVFEEDLDSDGLTLPECDEISVPFVSGVEGQIDGVDFTVIIHSKNEATLRLDCEPFGELTLEPNFDCGPCPEFEGDFSEDS